jgi:hypothetical protein
MKKHICTVSDKNYLTKGFTLYESLKENSEDFILHYLCIDESSYNILKNFESSDLVVYHVESLLNDDEKLKKLKDEDYRYFCWSLASYFSHYLLSKNNESIMYIDSDIILHTNIDVIYNEIGDKEIGIFRHRQFDLGTNRPEGLFNVGVVYFKNGYVGKKVCNWWYDAVLFKKYPEFATCGDQKYLDNFPRMCEKDLIFIDGNIGHGAPWHWQLYDYSDFEFSGNIIWNGERQKLVFTHFSQFSELENDYIPSTMHHIYTPLEFYKRIPSLKFIYDDYYKRLKMSKNKIYGQK